MRLVIGVSVVLLVWSGVSDLLLDDDGYVVRNLAATAVLLLVTRRTRLGFDELGTTRRALPSGVRWGLAAAAVVVAALVLAVSLRDRFGPLAALLHDERADLAATRLAYATLVRIPLGTVLFEEVAFRGVLDAAGRRVLTPGRAVAVSATVFGTYHVPPTLMALRINDVAATSAAGLGVLVGAVVVSTVGGAIFSWLRYRSGSLLAPALAHVATNAGGLLAAAAVQR